MSRRGTIFALALAAVGLVLPWFLYPVLAIDVAWQKCGR